MPKKRFVVLSCMLMLLVCTLLPVCNAGHINSTEEKTTVYIAGRFLTDFDLNDHSSYSNIWHFSLVKATSSGVLVNFSFTKKTLIWFMQDNKPTVMKGPKNFVIELTDMKSFVAFWWPPFSMLGIGNAKIFAVCDSITVH